MILEINSNCAVLFCCFYKLERIKVTAIARDNSLCVLSQKLDMNAQKRRSTYYYYRKSFTLLRCKNRSIFSSTAVESTQIPEFPVMSSRTLIGTNEKMFKKLILPQWRLHSVHNCTNDR